MSTTDATAHETGRTDGPGTHDWIGLPEAAVLFGLSRYTLARAARDEHLQTRRTGKIWLTTPVDVEAWLKGARHRPGRRPQRRTPGASTSSTRPETAPAVSL